MTIGESLKRARKKMGLDLDEVVHATKIAKMFLIALESDDITSLPPGVYARNFLRTYARFLKLDEDILTAEYHEQYSIKPQFVAQQEQTKLDNQHYMRRRNRRVSILAVCLAIPLAIYGLYLLYPDTFERLLVTPSAKTKASTPDVAAPGTFESPSNKSLGAVGVPLNDGGVKSEVAPSSDVQVPDSEGDAGNDLAVPVTDQAQGQEPVAPENGTAIEAKPEVGSTGAIEPKTVRLPVNSLEGLTVFPLGAKPSALENVFLIGALAEPVWLKVEIDGRMLSSGFLQPGDVRCFAYGTQHSLEIGNVSQVSIQDGGNFRPIANSANTNVSLGRIGPGFLFSTLDQVVQSLQSKPKGPSKTQESQ